MPETVDIPRVGALGMDDLFAPPTRRELVWTLVVLAAALTLAHLLTPLWPS